MHVVETAEEDTNQFPPIDELLIKLPRMRPYLLWSNKSYTILNLLSYLIMSLRLRKQYEVCLSGLFVNIS
jgi:hypothetical protein